jgi:glycerate-2-kinase
MFSDVESGRLGVIAPSEMNEHQLKTAAAAVFNAGIRAVDPEVCVRQWLRLKDDRLMVGEKAYPLGKVGKLFVVGIGKASAAMAGPVEALLGARIDHGLVITKYGHALPLKHCRVMEAGHPVPDESGVAAAGALLDLVSTAAPGDLVLCLISGGGSALSPAPIAGISLADKQAVTRQLLACGATIHEINTLRKHLSRIKGGRLCRRANGAVVVALILSDVIGDDLDIIASGVTAADPSTYTDCLDIIARYGLQDKIPDTVENLLAEGARGRIPETPKPQDPVFNVVDNRIVGSISDALLAAEQEAGRLGFNPMVLTSMIHGEAGEVAKVLCAIAAEIRRSGRPVSAPACSPVEKPP